MTDREIFRENLNRFMDESGCTQQKLADHVGAERSTVSSWTRGKAYPRADVMEKISRFFGVMLSDLVMTRSDREEEMHLLWAWRNADPTYKKVALELLESHQLGG